MFANKNGGAKQGGPTIMSSNGDLIWHRDGSDFGSQIFCFDTATYQGQPVLLFWAGSILTGYGHGIIYILDNTYTVIAKVDAGSPYAGQLDLHEASILPNGNLLIAIYTVVSYDLSSLGGPSNGYVYDNIVQEIEIATNNVVFSWSSVQHVPVGNTYINYAGRGTSSSPIDYFHINAIDKDASGNYLVSGRHTWTLYYIAPDGTILGYLGGKQNDFAIGPSADFQWQHDCRFTSANGATVSVFDNAASNFGDRNHQNAQGVSVSRGLLLNVDFAGKTSTLVQEFASPNNLISVTQGSVQALPNSNVMVGWGDQPWFTEFSSAGTALYEANFGACANNEGSDCPTNSYRTYKRNWVGNPATAPKLVVNANCASGSATAYMSWNGATQVASWSVSSGNSSNALTLQQTVPRLGFETNTTIPYAQYYQVTAYDASGNVLKSSIVSTAQAPCDGSTATGGTPVQVAGTVPGYTLSWANQTAAASCSGYMSYTRYYTYDTTSCANICSRSSSCVFFNIYQELLEDKSYDIICTVWSQNQPLSCATNSYNLGRPVSYSAGYKKQPAVSSSSSLSSSASSSAISSDSSSTLSSSASSSDSTASQSSSTTQLSSSSTATSPTTQSQSAGTTTSPSGPPTQSASSVPNFSLQWSNLNAAANCAGYVNYFRFNTYDVNTCANNCKAANCKFFNVYQEQLEDKSYDVICTIWSQDQPVSCANNYYNLGRPVSYSAGYRYQPDSNSVSSTGSSTGSSSLSAGSSTSGLSTDSATSTLTASATDSATSASTTSTSSSSTSSTPSQSAYPVAGYSLLWSNLQGAANCAGYITYYRSYTYDPSACSSYCTADSRCVFFNVYQELLEDKSYDIICTLWSVNQPQSCASNTYNLGRPVSYSAGYQKLPNSMSSSATTFSATTSSSTTSASSSTGMSTVARNSTYIMNPQQLSAAMKQQTQQQTTSTTTEPSCTWWLSMTCIIKSIQSHFT